MTETEIAEIGEQSRIRKKVQNLMCMVNVVRYINQTIMTKRVNGSFSSILKFWRYLKYATYRMLNRRDQKGRFKYDKFLRVWNYYIPEPHLTVNIWG